MALLEERGVAEAAAGGAGGVGGRHAAGDVALGEKADVLVELIGEFTISAVQAKKFAGSRKESTEFSHNVHASRWRLRTRSTTPEKRSQLSVSSASCFCPRLVMA